MCDLSLRGPSSDLPDLLESMADALDAQGARTWLEDVVGLLGPDGTFDLQVLQVVDELGLPNDHVPELEVEETEVLALSWVGKSVPELLRAAARYLDERWPIKVRHVVCVPRIGGARANILSLYAAVTGLDQDFSGWRLGPKASDMSRSMERIPRGEPLISREPVDCDFGVGGPIWRSVGIFRQIANEIEASPIPGQPRVLAFSGGDSLFDCLALRASIYFPDLRAGLELHSTRVQVDHAAVRAVTVSGVPLPELFRALAREVRRLGPIDVLHILSTIDDDTLDEVYSLTLYYIPLDK
jgi:hypothetical protein